MTAAPRRLTRAGTAERRVNALRMRRAGKSYRHIAEQLHYASASAASKDVHRALEDVRAEEGRAVLSLERERLDWLSTQLVPMIENGDVRAAREYIRLSTLRAKLLGLDQAAAAERDANSMEHAGSLLDDFTKAVHLAYESGYGRDDDAPDD